MTFATGVLPCSLNQALSDTSEKGTETETRRLRLQEKGGSFVISGDEEV